MTVSLDWLVNVQVIINTTVIQVPTFNNCMIMAAFPVADKPARWTSAISYAYTNSVDIISDFTTLYSAAIIATQFAQAFKYQIVMTQATEFFSQTPTPNLLYVACLDNTSTINYVTQFDNIVASTNNWYAFTIADQITATQLTTADTGIYAALAAQKSKGNLKVGFFDTADLAIISGHFLYDATNGGIGNQRAFLCAHTNNPQTAVPSGAVAAPTVCLGAACMGAYFTNLFTAGIGLKSISGQQLQSTAADSAIDATTLGTPGAVTGILGVNGNVYPAYGISGIGLIQYGFMASSNSSALVYLDQVVGADYIKLNVQADLVTYLLSQQPTGGVPYNDAGIQALVNVFKKTLQGAVTQNIIQQFTNSNISFVTYANTPGADKTNRIYQGLSAALRYLGRIQTMRVGVTLSL